MGWWGEIGNRYIFLILCISQMDKCQAEFVMLIRCYTNVWKKDEKAESERKKYLNSTSIWNVFFNTQVV